ncbi:unnamed protein product [Prorocentrum cordatum]|uniref:Pentatricopeptide repeat-containing protein n=1 Tax=Prorocentrum cordatum TaxID=2364126 RepID=A0ABN9PW55_9DINO|nr:unnamed protein product [Polarella glacialis]
MMAMPAALPPSLTPLAAAPAARYGLLAVLVCAALCTACLSASGGGAGQKVAAALEETWVVLALLIAHLVVSRLHGGGAEKKKAQQGPKKGAPAAAEGPSDDEVRAEAVGKLTTRIRAAVKARDMPGAEALMQEMREVGGPPGRQRRPCWAVAFGELVGGYVRDGSAAKANEWLGAFADCVPTIRPSTACVNSVIGALCAGGDVAAAEAWVQKMPEIGIRLGEDTYSEIVGGCVRAGDMPRAVSWFREMRRANVRPSAELNRLMLQACAADCRGGA